MKLKMWQAITVVVVLVGSGAGTYQWRHSAKSSAVALLPANTQLATAQLGNVVNAVTASGTMSFTNSSDLTFGSSGTVAKVNVVIGDSVKKGQSLASIDTADLQRAVTQANVNLTTAQTNLTNLQELYTADDLAKAKASLALATANLNKALQALTDGQTPDPLQVAVKQAAANAAQNAYNLASTPDPNVVTSRQNAVSLAQINLQNAQTSLATLQASPSAADLNKAQLAVAQAQVSLEKANSTYVADHAKFLLGTVSQATLDVDLANMQLSGLNLIAAQNALTTLQAGPAVSDVTKAQVAVSQAQMALSQTQQDLTNAQTPDPLVVAQKRLALSQAQTDLTNIQTVDPVVQAQLQLNIVNARIAVNTAQDNLTTVQAGPNVDDVAAKTLAVDNTKAALTTAQTRLDQAMLLAPFDGVVSAVNVITGQTVGANAIAVSVVDSTTPKIDAAVSEADVSKVKQGQTAAITLDGIPGVSITGKVLTVAVVGKTAQGVVSYPITVQVTPPQGATLRQGMTATVSLTVSQAMNVLTVPSRAIGGTTRNPTVTVRSNGQDQVVAVTLGLTDGAKTQVLSGLNPGDQVVSIASTSSSRQGSFQVGGGGVIPGGGGGGGAIQVIPGIGGR